MKFKTRLSSSYPGFLMRGFPGQGIFLFALLGKLRRFGWEQTEKLTVSYFLKASIRVSIRTNKASFLQDTQNTKFSLLTSLRLKLFRHLGRGSRRGREGGGKRREKVRGR